MSMLSQCARAGSAAEQRFRVPAPNSVPRDMLVVALDDASAGWGPLLAGPGWIHAQFCGFRDAAGRLATRDWRTLLTEQDFDFVLLVGTAGEELEAASRIGALCFARGIKLGGLLLAPHGAASAEISAGLAMLRPWVRTLAVADDAEYLPGLLHALGA